MEEHEHEGFDFMLHHDDYADEALSLCDLAMGEEDGDDSARSPHHVHRSTAEEFFEFLTDFSSQMCSAEDIIVCGKLTPSDVGNPVQRRSESLSETKFGSSNRSDIFKPSVMRNCRSLHYDKIHHHSIGSGQRQYSRLTHHNSSEKSGSAMLAKNRLSLRPRWYAIMFGPVSNNVHAMDRLRDIKSRQLRRSPSNLLFPRTEAKAYMKDSTGCGGFKDSSWKFLHLLSCQTQSSVAVSSSYVTCNKA